MRRRFVLIFVALFAAGVAIAQRAVPPAPPVGTSELPATPPANAIAYYDGPSVTAPELLPISLSDAAANPCEKRDGGVTLSEVVDAQGVPVDIFFLKPLGSDLDLTALLIASLDRFKPGARDGSPVAVVVIDEIGLQTCVVNARNKAGKKISVPELRSPPSQKVALQSPPTGIAALNFIDSQVQITAGQITAAFKPGPGVTPPVVIHHVEAEFSDSARSNHVSGACLVSLTVDTHGMPRDLRIEKSVEPGLDQNALRAISQYRFKPAMKDGIPFAARITVEVDYRF